MGSPGASMSVSHYDAELELSIIGAAITWPERLDICDDLAPEDFYVPSHSACWRAVVALVGEGTKPDIAMVADRTKMLGYPVEPVDLLAASLNALPPQRSHIEVLLRHARARRLSEAAHFTLEALNDKMDPDTAADHLAGLLGDLRGLRSMTDPEAINIPQLATRSESMSPWIIEGLLRSDWRAVIVGEEGKGKSLLLRQIAIAAAQGIHPLKFRSIPPIRTLIVDLENPAAAILETGLPLDQLARQYAGDDYDPDRCRIWMQPGGLDLRSRKDRGALEREIAAQQPQLVVLGPVYKSYRRVKSEGYEDAADDAQVVLDQLRMKYHFALVLEHHAPKGHAGYRELAPFGSQRWLAWPELGISLEPTKDERVFKSGRFRGDRLESRWPDEFHHGREWPWEGKWIGGRHA